MILLDTLSDPAARRSLIDRTRLTGVFVLVFALVCAVLSVTLRSVSQAPDMSVLSPKLEYFQAHSSEYDTVFLGTSRTFYHIIPDVVETGAAQAGCSGLSVYNFGVFGLTGAEQDWLLESILEVENVQRVIVEDPLPQPREFSEATTQRARYFNAPTGYGAAIDSVASYPESLPKRVFRTGILAYGAAYDLSGVGRAASLAFPAADPSAKQTFDMSESGFEALGAKMTDGIQARRDEFLSDPDGFEQALDLYGRDSPNLDARAAYLIDKLGKIEAAGKSAALYISPDLLELDRTAQVGKRVAAIAPASSVLNFNRPDIYPELFEREVWYDFSHLSRAGAERLSQTVGRALCETQNEAEEGKPDAVR